MKRIGQGKKIVRIKIIPLQCLKSTIPATDHKSMINDIFTTDFYTFKKRLLGFTSIGSKQDDILGILFENLSFLRVIIGSLPVISFK